MLRELQLLRALDGSDRRLLVAALGWVLAARAALHAPGRSFVRKQAALDALARSLPSLPSCTSSAACWAVTAASKRVPGTVCLPWALALKGLLAQSGRHAELRIGVAPRATPDLPLDAHAWLECDGEQLTWGQPVERYDLLRARPGRTPERA
jgi:hypothetical protein